MVRNTFLQLFNYVILMGVTTPRTAAEFTTARYRAGGDTCFPHSYLCQASSQARSHISVSASLRDNICGTRFTTAREDMFLGLRDFVYATFTVFPRAGPLQAAGIIKHEH